MVIQKKSDDNLCSYGCGHKALYEFKNGVLCCSKHWQQCEVYRKQRSEISRKVFSNEDVIKQMSNSLKGRIAWNKGKPRTSWKNKPGVVWNKGKTGIYLSETLERMSLSHKNKGSYWLGKSRSKDTIEKISTNHADIYGSKNPNWKGGISYEPYCPVWTDKEFKEDIKQRDNYICQNPECWHTSDSLCIHHIDYNKKNCSPNNLITLCVSCNSRANTNRELHTNLYQDLLHNRYGYTYNKS